MGKHILLYNDCMNPINEREEKLETFTDVSSKLATLTFENRTLKNKIRELIALNSSAKYISKEHKHLNGMLRTEIRDLKLEVKKLKGGRNG
mgnify:CR=1 FL=1